MSPITPFTPIQYVMGRTEFCGLDIQVDERVLIPRPETEILVHTALEIARSARDMHEKLAILDLCTGSGNIALSLAAQLTKSESNCTILASDISPDALAVARRNAIGNGIYNIVEFVESDLFRDIKGQFSIIVSNPPYIARHEFSSLQEEVLREPHIALDGGADGLDFYRRIFNEAHRYLRRGGAIAVEIGFGQRAAIEDIIRKGGLFAVVDCKRDQNGLDRILVAKWIN